MFKASLLIAALLAACSTVASADRVDLTLGWNACRVNGTGAAKGACFACDTEVGSNQLVAAILPNATSNLVGINAVDCYIDIRTDATPILPAWWQFADPSTGQSGCRALSSQFPTDALNAAALDCDYSYWPRPGNVVWGTSYRYPSDEPIVQLNHGKLRVIVAMDPALASSTRQPVAGEETYLFSAQLKRGGTVAVPGPPCAGCATQVSLTFYKLDVFQINDDNFRIDSPGSTPANRVTWQVAADCEAPTADRNYTWGAIKSIYR